MANSWASLSLVSVLSKQCKGKFIGGWRKLQPQAGIIDTAKALRLKV